MRRVLDETVLHYYENGINITLFDFLVVTIYGSQLEMVAAVNGSPSHKAEFEELYPTYRDRGLIASFIHDVRAGIVRHTTDELGIRRMLFLSSGLFPGTKMNEMFTTDALKVYDRKGRDIRKCSVCGVQDHVSKGLYWEVGGRMRFKHADCRAKVNRRSSAGDPTKRMLRVKMLHKIIRDKKKAEVNKAVHSDKIHTLLATEQEAVSLESVSVGVVNDK